MTYDHNATSIHRADLDREIDTIRTERLLDADRPRRDSLIDRLRHGIGRVLIATGTALVGRESGSLRTHRA
ncbi:MAG: hypothetical protein H0U52_02650 [Chloroflexi bacterium]|nr:hypothetical protein [Chloroflexota bacterium]